MKNKTSLSIIIPAYKESKRIGATLISLNSYLKKKKFDYEIIVVNDGSPDDQIVVLNKYLSRIKNLKIIDNKENHGKGYAVKCGMLAARGDYCLFMDADNSVKISNLKRFLMYARRGYEVVIGSIMIGSHKKIERNGPIRRFLSVISKFPVRLLATPGIYDTQRGFKLFSRRAVDTIFPHQTVERFAFDIELLAIAQSNGFMIKEVPVRWDNPTGSTLKFSAYFDSLTELIRITILKMLGKYQYGEGKKPSDFWFGEPRKIFIALSALLLVFSLNLLFKWYPVNDLLVETVFSAYTAEAPSVQNIYKNPAEEYVLNNRDVLPITEIRSFDELTRFVRVKVYSLGYVSPSDVSLIVLILGLFTLLGIDLSFGNVSSDVFQFIRKKIYSHI